MDYNRIYGEIILRSKNEKRKKLKVDDPDYIYYELHHIIPKCIKKDESKENKVLLTAKEHFICHKLLVKIYSDSDGLKHALWLMCSKSKKRDYKIGAREYERERNEYIKNFSGVNAVFYDKKHKPETKAKIKENHADFSGSNHPQWKKKKSKETCDKISKTKTGKPSPMKGVKLTFEIWNKGIKMSEEFNKKNSEGQKNIPKKQCEWCGEVVSHMTYNRNHGDRCVLYPDYKIEDHLIYCPNCNMVGIFMSNMERYHFDNCKNIKLKEQIQKIIKKLKNQLTLQNS